MTYTTYAQYLIIVIITYRPMRETEKDVVFS